MTSDTFRSLHDIKTDIGLRCLVVASLGLIAGFANANAQAQPTKDCRQFSLFVDHVSVNSTRAVDGKSSPGDRRFGYTQLIDEDSESVGTLYFDATVLTANAGSGATLLGTLYYVLERGSLIGGYLPKIPDHSQEHTLDADAAVYPISGGTGAYLGATGSVSASTTGDGRRRFDFDISC